MENEFNEFLDKVAKELSEDPKIAELQKEAFLNPLENSMFANLLSGAVKGLETVALATFDIKLVAISKMLRAWYNEKEKEAEKAKVQREFGADAWEDTDYSGYGSY